MIRFSRTLLLALCSLALAAGLAGATEHPEHPSGAEHPSAKKATEPVVTLVTTQGDIVLHFFPELAPEHVKNFLWHAENTYTGCLFHRVIPGFMIQGGDPNSKDDDPANDGMGGYSYKGEGTSLKAEFSDRHHARGILSMARSRDPDSAGSQFFIVHGEAPFLDGKYTVFGEVVEGIDVVDAIANAPRNSSNRPDEDQKILEVKIGEWPTAKIDECLATMQDEDLEKTKGK